MRRIRLFLFYSAIFVLGARVAASGQSVSPRVKARELPGGDAAATAVELYRPVDLVLDEDSLFVLDMDDHNIKVFSKAGTFLYTIGRKGQGPGEFHRPCGLDVLDGCVYVADAGNRRIQVLDKRGTHLTGFKVPFSPYRILALEEDKMVVLGLPSGRFGGEKLLHCFDGVGKPSWEAIESFFSGDSVYDLMRNRMFIRKTEAGEVWLVPGADSRIVRRMSAAGFMLGEIKVDERYALEEVEIATGGGRKKSLRPLCWNCALDRGTLYLLIPEKTEDGDLGPGRTIAAVGRSGEMIALIELPAKVSRIAVEGKKVFTVDLESRLRLFSMESE